MDTSVQVCPSIYYILISPCVCTDLPSSCPVSAVSLYPHSPCSGDGPLVLVISTLPVAQISGSSACMWGGRCTSMCVHLWVCVLQQWRAVTFGGHSDDIDTVTHHGAGGEELLLEDHGLDAYLEPAGRGEDMGVRGHLRRGQSVHWV